MSVTILLPLLLTLVTALAVTLYVVKCKALAQALCVQEALRLQNNLRKPLQKLIALNPQATALRARRAAADRALQEAIKSGIPYAIAAATAVDTEVYLEQLAFRARQEALLIQAEDMRRETGEDLRQRVEALGGRSFEAPRFYWRALAVEPKPEASLTPNYNPIAMFETGQQQRYHYKIDLLERWPVTRPPGLELEQTTECAVTLKGEDHRWETRIVAARAASRP